VSTAEGAGAGRRPVRVVLVTPYYPAHRGGVERIAGELAARLAAAGDAEFLWFASDCDPPPPPAPGLAAVPAGATNACERRLGVPYPLWSPAAHAALARAVRATDLVHLHDALYQPCLAAFAAARACRRPVLVTQHVGHVPYRNALLRAALAGANRTLAAAVLARAERVVFESESVRAYFSRFVRFAHPPLLVPNGVDTERFHPASAAEREQLRRRLGVGEGQPLVLFVGRFVEKKGLAVIAELAAHFPRVLWLLAGWGPIDPTRWGLANVRVVSKPDINALLPLYRAADLLVLPSVGEGFPLAVQEAMACGTPALVGAQTAAGCGVPGAPILAEPTGVADAVARWKRRLAALLARAEELARMRDTVCEFARREWSWARCIAAYRTAIDHCLRDRQ